ncbi:hypothetical protein V6N11_025957 [Hibiscus sabdariffa]|uniref:DUF4283 domain-containing protein n=1 Tax=Hibiscus sabdariffa TaxID=183260 RepID=A0ABR2SV08_9ROSI
MAETFDPGLVNSRNSRKHRRLDDNPLDGGGDTRPVGLSRPSSYKDSLMKDAVEAIPDVDEAFEEDEIDIQEGDVTRSLVDGVISIDFSDRVQSMAEKRLDQTLVVKLLGRRIGYTTLRTKIYDLWKPKQAIRLMDIENDYFLVSFKLRSDYLKVLAEGPWTIFDHYLTVQQWTPEFSTSGMDPSSRFTDMPKMPQSDAPVAEQDVAQTTDTVIRLPQFKMLMILGLLDLGC